MLAFIKKYKAFITLLLVFAFALFLRLYRLGTLPANFHEDEVLSGFIGRYILQNGRDTYGNIWPLLYFNKFGDFYIILPVYLSGLATYIFGINEFAVRFPIAFFGALAIFPVYILAYWATKNKTISLISAFFTAIIPWQLVLGRSTTEGIIGSTLFLTGIVFFLQSIKKQKVSLLVLSSIFFFITYDIYHPFRLYTPLMFIPAFLIFRNHMKKKQYILTYLFSMIVFFALTLYIGTTFWGKGRFVQTSIFSPLSGVSIKINELMFGEGQQNITVARIFHNKVVMYGRELINQYLSYFSPSLLFINGWQKSRYYVPEQGLLLLSFLAFLFLAILPIRTKPQLAINNQQFIFLLFLLFLAPFPAAFTVVESPNVHRALLMSYILVIIASYGFYKGFFLQFKKISVSHILSVILLFEFIFFWHQYSQHMNLYSSLIRNDPQKKVALYAGEKSKTYDEIILPAEGAMSWYYLFYNKDFSPEYIGRFRLDARIDRTKKIRYIENSCPTNALNDEKFTKKVLIIDRYNCVSNSGFRIIDTITDVNPLMTYKVLVPN